MKDWLGCTLTASLIALALVPGCSDDEPVLEPPPRAVKTVVVREQSAAQLRRFPGTIEAVDTSAISFEVAGLVQEMLVEAGDGIQSGEVLARLDPRPFELALESARAASARSEAQLKEKEAAFERQRRMQIQDAGATSQEAVDQARAAFESATQNVGYSRAQLDLAERDLTNTDLVAPYDGIVAARHVSAFEEVSRGQAVLDVFANGGMEVAVQVAENSISGIRMGQPAEVRLPNRPGEKLAATVSEVGSSARSANSFPVRARITDTDPELRPGMSAELWISFGDQAAAGTFTVPMHALVDGEDLDGRYVFVYDSASSTARKRAVQSSTLVGDEIVITGGLSLGDLVVVAGASFLRDGQPVKLLDSQQAER